MGEGLPRGRHAVALLLSVQVFAPGDHVGVGSVRVIHHLALRRLRIFHVEEVNRECHFRVRGLLQQGEVARLDEDTRPHVIPWHVLLQQGVELPRLVFGVGVERLLIETRYGLHQVARLLLAQHARRADVARAARAARRLVGSPFRVAVPAGDDRVVHRRVGLGLIGGRHGHVVSNLGGLHGLHRKRGD